MDRLGDLLLPGSPLDLGLFAAGWLLGWALLARPRTVPAAPDASDRPAVTVVVPARDEEAQLPHLLAPLVAQRRTHDRIVVVDDRSTDATAAVADAHGVEVVTPPEPPDGWRGKPHACWVGAGTGSEPVLVFLDADVRPGPTLLDDLVDEVGRHPSAVVSMQPWHDMATPGEQTSLLANVTALMACGAFTLAGDRVATTVAFGPVIALRRETYDAVEGHANPTVRSLHTEDIGLARAVGRSRLFVGTPTGTRFRMYPGGVRELVAGWTRSIATGARYTPWWLVLATLAWVWSLSGGWIAAPIVYPLSALQVWVLGRRAGTVRWWAAALFPLLVLALVVVVVRSTYARLLGRDVTWKGRRVPSRPS